MDSQFVFVDRCRSTKRPDSPEPSPTTFAPLRITKHRTRCKLKPGTTTSEVQTSVDSSKQLHLEQCKYVPFDDEVQNDEWPDTVQEHQDFGTFDNTDRNSDRFTKRRTSLHGKTITVRISRNETKYRKFQAQTYNFLERPKTWPSIAYHVLVFASVFGCLILSVLSTIQEYTMSAGRILLYMELAILFWFFTEYCIRLWSAGCRSRYQTWRGRIQFARRPFCIVDVIVIVASVVVLAVDSDRNMFTASALRGLRFFQILRMIRMDRRGGSFKLLASVVWAHRQELFTTVYIGFLGLIFSSFLIYLVEKKENEKIKTYADALWWGVVTLCTVGYGDTVPRTWIGKIIAAFCSLAGISFFALPAGILGSGFALKVQQHQRQKHLIRRRVPAATLIQCLWRCYAADPHSASVATWKVHMRPVRKPVGLTASSSMIERGGFSRFGRFSTLKRRPEKAPHALASSSSSQPIEFQKQLNGAMDENSVGPKSAPVIQTQCDPSFMLPVETKLDGLPDDANETDYRETQFLKEKLDKDPISPIKNRILNDLTMAPTNRLRKTVPQLNDPLSPGAINAGTPISSRGYAQSANPSDSWLLSNPARTPSNENSTIQIDRQLTEREKLAIRTIRKMRFLVARRKFREALRPYDVKDVIEQYSAGHLDMLTRVKILQSRLDQILGRQGSKTDDVYDSHQSLASRIVKIEHKIDAVELKIDRLSNMYKTERIGRLYPTTTDFHVGFRTSSTQSENMATCSGNVPEQHAVTAHFVSPVAMGRSSFKQCSWDSPNSGPMETEKKQVPSGRLRLPKEHNASCECFIFPETGSFEHTAVAETPVTIPPTNFRVQVPPREPVHSSQLPRASHRSKYTKDDALGKVPAASTALDTSHPQEPLLSNRYSLSDWTTQLTTLSQEDQQSSLAVINQPEQKQHNEVE